jgi:DNA-directed RNA polymerase sigma subunit (sigma70/sigma32)
MLDPLSYRRYTEGQILHFVSERPEALGCLSERERGIWVARHPDDGSAPVSVKELAGVQGVSPERIRQIERYADRKVRRLLDRDTRKCRHCDGKGWA